MPLFNLKFRSVPDSANYALSDFLTGSVKEGYVSAQVALANSDIFATVNLLSGDLAGARFVAQAPRFQAMLDKPSSMANGHLFWKSVFLQMLIGGEAFVYRWRNRNGVDLEWEYLRPSQVSTYELDNSS